MMKRLIYVSNVQKDVLNVIKMVVSTVILITCFWATSVFLELKTALSHGLINLLVLN